MAGFSGALGSLWVEIGARITDFQTKMGEVSQQIDAVVSDAKSKLSALDIGKGLVGVGAGLTAAITTPIIGIGAASITAAAEMDGLIRGLTAVSDVSDPVADQLERLKRVAELPGLGFREAVAGSINLQAAGFSAADAEGALRGFGNALATVGKGKADLDGVVLALGQIASKGKISAEEINQLAERVPQIRQIMLEAFGTADTEVLQKAGIGAEDFVRKVTEQLLKLPQVTGGVTNAFENLSDKMNQTFAAIGKNLEPVTESITGVLSQVLDWAKDAAEWFGKLPDPIQKAAGAFVAVGAAVGPLMIAVGAGLVAFSSFSALFTSGGLLAGLGLTAGAFSSLVLIIPLVVAALVALGAWVYSNWDAIQATLEQAWDGVTDIWHAVWDPIGEWLTEVWDGIGSTLSTAWDGIVETASMVWGPAVSFFSTLWDGIGPYFKAAWDGIAGALTAVWEGIKNVATSVWSAITGAIGTFLEWAAKIPGVNKLMNLDDAWTSAKKAAEEIKKTAAATEDLKKKSESAAGSGKPIPKLATGLGNVAKKAKEAEDKVKPLIQRSGELDAMARQLEASYKKHNEEIAAARIKLQQLGDKIIEVVPPSKALDDSIQAIITSMQDVSKNSTPAVIDSLNRIKGTSSDLRSALQSLGVTSATEYQKVAEEAKKAYEVVKGSGIATPTEQNNAMLAMLKAQKDAMVANGQSIPAEMQAMLDKMGNAATNTSTGVPKATGAFKSFATEVSTVITNLSQDLVKGLFSGTGSFADKGIDALGKLGQAVLTKFTEPFAKAATDLMSGVISDLIGGKGFGGIIDKVKDVGSAIADVFGAGASTVSGAAGTAGQAAGSVGSTAGGAAGTAGQAGGAIASGGITAIVGAVGSVVSAISGVIGNFQMSAMNAALDNIVKHTLQTANDMANLRADEWAREASLFLKLDDIWNEVRNQGEGLGNHLQGMVGKLDLALLKLDAISSNTFYGLASSQENGGVLNQMLTELRTMAGKSPIINIYMDGQKQAATGTQMKLQGALI